jgi:hypothetical protein
MRMVDAIGRAIGGLISPVTWMGSLMRAARLFHPDGVVYRADVVPLASEGEMGKLAHRMEGPALVRLSGGLWRWRGGQTERRPDVLGVAVRFRRSSKVEAVARAGDQDLLFESSRSLWTLPLASFTTDRSDFLANEYYGMQPFDVRELGKVKLRLVPLHPAPAGRNRRERLEHAVAAGDAALRLEVRTAGGSDSWTELANIVLRGKAELDQQALRFDPFRTGLGIVPAGWINKTRLAAYAASASGRTIGGSGRS